MTDKIIDLLKKSGADAWEVSDKVTEAWEFYFIGHELDQNRVRNVEHIDVKVYRKLADGKFLGSASDEIPPTATEAEAARIISDLYERASYVKNPYYELNKKSVTATSAEVDVEKTARDYIEALQQIPETSTEDINSYEIFTEKLTKRFVNSEGIDVTTTQPISMVEVVVNARNDDHEIELYRMYNAGTCDKDHLVKELTDTLKFGKDRLIAGNTPSLGKASVLFSTGDAKEFYYFLATQMHASYKYRNYSKFEIGKPIAEDVKGDKITIQALKDLPNSSRNTPIDSEGAEIRDMYLIKDNIPETYWGDCQFRYYMDVKDSFIVSNYKVEGGSSSEADIRQGQYLEVVEVSDLQVESLSGNFATEIRLAYWHDGDKCTPVSGGSISGNVMDLLKNIKMSKELKQYDNFLMPSVLMMEGVTIAGV